MATSRTDIISKIAIAYMRATTLQFAITNTKPNTKLYAFFDGVSVDGYITPAGGMLGDQVVTDSSGGKTGTFTINDYTYPTGTKTLSFQDSPNFTTTSIPGSTVSSASAKFTSSGTLITTQDTITNINTVVVTTTIDNNVIGSLGDPLAQSFFTQGVTGGINVTKIDIFFQSKEDSGSIPVTLEIRELVSGYPSPKLASNFSRVVLNPDEINISDDASIGTSFVFDTPIFLPENRDWCFVLLSNSNKYNVWTAKLGEKSRETGMVIYEQPFIGSMYKSENNVTWTTDSTEDIKFIIYKAVYDNSIPTTVTLKAKANKLLIYGNNISVMKNMNTMNIKTDHLHGLRNGDKIRLLAPVGTSTYRGITATQLSGVYTVIYIDEYNVSIRLPSGKFTTTGTLSVPGIVNEIQVDDGGSGYNVNTTITIVGDCITPATATANVNSDGVITSVTMTNRGSGYITKPTVVVSGDGSGASLFLISETVIQIETNRVYDEIFPRIAKFSPASTNVSATIKTTTSDYSVMDATQAIPNVAKSMLGKSILVSNDNTAAFLPGQTTTEIVVSMNSDNKNVSPLLSISETPTIECRAYIINNQTEYETISPSIVNSSGSISRIDVVGGGFGYNSTAVTISPPNIKSGIQATATAVLLGTIVDYIVINNVGSGYTSPPSIRMTQILETPAQILSNITPFNSELLPSGGSAKSKYITKPITLNNVSTGAVIYASAYSEYSSSFDFYIRTSLRSDVSTHNTLPWKMMFCDVSRNKSSKPNEFIDYTFTISDLTPFDVYDIKIVLRTTNRVSIPIIDNYRCIILAT